MVRCIFCKSNTPHSTSVEHILPESLGNAEHTLIPGVVCDSCNNYFARKIEKPVLDSGMFRLLRADRKIPNKRGHLPSFAANEAASLPEYRLMSRFLGKVGLEVLASRVIDIAGWNDELVENHDLDDLRQYVRYNIGAATWPFSYRTVYPVNAVFREDDTHYEVLHEYQLLCTPKNELFVVLAILGVEFAFNLGGPHLDGYHSWLEEHRFESPLYISPS